MKLIYSSLITLFLLSNVSAQKYEAENSSLTGGALVQNLSSASNGKIVSSQEGDLTFTINKTTKAYYNIFINASSSSSKINNFEINGTGTSFTVNNPNYTNIKVGSFVQLNAGNNTLKIAKSWGWINIDYIELVEVNPNNRFNINQTLVNPNATDRTKKLYQFLLDNYGKKIISGVMTLNSFDDSDWLKQQTGKEPALLGIDFMQTNRGYTWYNNNTPANDARTWYNKNGIPAMMWHWRDPSRTTEEFYTNKTSFDINDIFNKNSANYAKMISDIDFVSNQFKTLQTDGVPVIWRPLHEAAGGWFWWGAKGAAPCKELYKVMYDRMVNYHGLNNLIWVWTREPGDDAWYPGDAYVDIVGRDIYKDGDHTSQVLEFNNMNDLYGGKKMLAISESGSFPDIDNIRNDLAAWSWYMPWYGEYTRDAKYNSLALWKKMFASEYVITLDKMPNLKTYLAITGFEDYDLKTNTSVFPTIVSNNVKIESSGSINTIQVFDILGTEHISIDNINTSDWSLNLENLTSGTYIVVVNKSERTKIEVK
jgi:mannan endo-1,4-beta-mannosidase